MALAITSSPNLNSTATSLVVSWTGHNSPAALYVDLLINGTEFVSKTVPLAPASGSTTVTITAADQEQILTYAYGISLVNAVGVRVHDSIGNSITKYGYLSISHTITNLNMTVQEIPINLSTGPLLNLSWTKPSISGLPADAFAGKVTFTINSVSTVYTSGYETNNFLFHYLNSTEITTFQNALGAYMYGNLTIIVETWFKTGSSSYTVGSIGFSASSYQPSGVYQPKTLTITSGTPNFTDTGSITVSWTGMQYSSNTITLYMIVNGSNMSKVVNVGAGATSVSYSLGTDALYNELYNNATGHSLADAIILQINEYNGGGYYTYAQATGGDLTISKRLTSFGVSTAEPLNLDAPGNIIASWARPPYDNAGFTGIMDVYVGGVRCAVKQGNTGVNSALTTTEKNAMIAAMNEVSPSTITYVLFTLFNSGSFKNLSGTQTIVKTNQLIKTFYFESTGTLTPFTVSSSLTSMPYTLTIDPRNPANINHTLVLKVNGVTITTETGILTSGNLTIDASMRTAILNACPTLTNTATLDITTYMGTEFVDTVTTSAVIVTIGTEYQPSISALTHTELVAWVNTFAGGYLSTKSTIGFTFTETPSLGATVSSYTVIYNGIEFTLSTDAISINPVTSGSIPVSGRIMDTRGRTATISISNVTIKDYTVPSLSYLETTRAVYEEGAYRDDTLGTYCHYQFTASVCSILNGSTQVNELRYRLGYKIKGAANYTYYTEVDTNSLSKTLENVYKDSYSAADIYEVVLEVHDLAYTGTPIWTPIYDELSKAMVCMLWGDNVVSVGKIWEQGTLDVGGDIYMNNEKVATQNATLSKNWIINGGFDIWQRGTTQTLSGYYSDDRWGNEHSGSTKTASKQAFALGQIDVPNFPNNYSRTVVTSVAGAGNYVLKKQAIEDVTKLAGKTITLSFWAKANATKNIGIEFYQYFGATSGYVFIPGTKYVLSTAWQKITHTVTLPSASGKTIEALENSLTMMRFWFDAGTTYNSNSGTVGQQSGTFEIANVSLVIGSGASEWQPEAYADVLRQCQRYYFRLGGTGLYNAYGSAVISSTTSAQCFVQFPIMMRTVPTTTSMKYNLIGVNDGQATIGISAITWVYATHLGILFGGTVTGAVVYRPYQLLAVSSTSSYFAIDCEF